MQHSNAMVSICEIIGAQGNNDLAKEFEIDAAKPPCKEPHHYPNGDVVVRSRNGILQEGGEVSL